MSPRRKGLPRPEPTCLAKSSLLRALAQVDAETRATKRILRMEKGLTRRIAQHVDALPVGGATLADFKTNPFVLLFHSFRQSYERISQLEGDLLPAKVFSSMETSAGKMVEDVVLPVYGWRAAPSEMHTPYSVVDGICEVSDGLRLVTLKSGPRCLNDDTSDRIADAIVSNYAAWALDAGVSSVDFTYGALYGTRKQSNKKDWHILRKVCEKLPDSSVNVLPTGRWHCEFEQSGVTVRVTVRIGDELWRHIAGRDTALVELCVALVRACVAAGKPDPDAYRFVIPDLPQIISLDAVPDDFAVSILQRSQLQWLFFMARHFCDELTDTGDTV